MSQENYYYTVDFGVNYSGHGYGEEDVKKIINDAYNSGVDKVVCISNNMNEAKNNIKLALEIPQLHFTLGVHPHNAKLFKDSDLTFISENLANEKCFGIGEIGLDFNRNFSPQDKQIYAFRKQLELAKNKNAKIYLHCRDAYDEFIKIIKELDYYNGIVHCFTGTLNQARELTNLGFKLGITGWLLDKRRNSDLQKVIQSDDITLNMLLVETDAPFMPVKPKKYSLPEDTALVVQRIAELKGINEIECGKALYKNAMSFLVSNK